MRLSLFAIPPTNSSKKNFLSSVSARYRVLLSTIHSKYSANSFSNSSGKYYLWSITSLAVLNLTFKSLKLIGWVGSY
jgi:hypothetical protein